MVLNGVGGKTIEEAKDNMSIEEARRWKAYGELRGGLNPARRLDTAITKLTFYTLAIAGSKDIELEELLWWEQAINHNEREESDSSSLEKMLMLLKAQSSNKTKTTTSFKRN